MFPKLDLVFSWVRVATVAWMVVFAGDRIASGHGPQNSRTYAASMQRDHGSSELNDARQEAEISSLDQRIAHIEAVHPDVLAEQFRELTKRFDEQKQMEWAIFAAVVINFITGSPKWPWKKG